MHIATLQIAVLDAFKALNEDINRLCDAIQQEGMLIAWVHDEGNPRDKATEVIRQLYYQDGQAPREIILLPGFIGTSQKTLALAQKVNQRKDEFKASVLLLKKNKLLSPDKNVTFKLNEFFTQHYIATNPLKNMGLGRIHLKQCYRKIPLLSEGIIPEKISWTWANTRSIKKISVQKAKELLTKKGNDIGITMQLKKLEQLPGSESLAIVQELAPHLRMNIVFNANNTVQRMMIKGPIPLLFQCDNRTPFPKFTPPKDKQAKNENRLTRSDVKLEPVPYLNAIRAHRYAFSK